jgi:hypothetical protein
MKTSVPANPTQSLRFLPRDRKTLDYILGKLAVNSSPERFELLKELFERHRTSVGFDPAILSKGRYKRFKAFEIRQVLIELERDLSLILNSPEFITANESTNTYKELFEQYLVTIELLSAPPSKSLNDQVDGFCKMLIQEGAYELLLSFYRQAYSHFTSRNVRINDVITDYKTLVETLDYQNALTLCGLQTVQLMQDSYRGNVTQEEFLLHFGILNKLIEQTTDFTVLYELKLQAVRIALHLDKRAVVLRSLTADIYNSGKKGIILNIETEAELICAASLFDTATPYSEKMEILAGQSVSRKISPYYIVLTKLTEALLLADAGDLINARVFINAAEHLLIKNSFRNIQMKKAWMDLQTFRFFINMTEEINGTTQFDKTEYQVCIQAVRDAGDEIKEARKIADGLQAMMHLLKYEKEIAQTLLSEWLEVSKNYNMLTALINYLALIANEKSSGKNILLIENQIADLKEPFYSTVFLKSLKTLHKNNKK